MDMGPFSEAEIRAWPTQNGQVTLIIKQKNNDKVVGFSNFHHFKNDGREAQVGILIDPLHQRDGYGIAALNETCQYGFNTLQLKYITGYTKFGNTASEKIMKRCGFVVDHYDNQKKRTYYYLDPKINRYSVT